MRRACFLAALMLLCICASAQADVFNMGSGLTNLETVTVGDPGNSPCTPYGAPYFGSVSYTYNIGKYEVTAAQYCDFLNHKAKSDPYELYKPYMALVGGYFDDACGIVQSGVSGNYIYSVVSGYANRPVNAVTFWNACRFANWLNNGQGNGDTETGAYTLNGLDPTDATTLVPRNSGATWFIPSVDEWSKAAYYKGGGTSSGYGNATQSDEDADKANLWGQPGHPNGHPVDVGSYPFPSHYGTFDQAGNVAELTESWIGDPFYNQDHTVLLGYSYDHVIAGGFYETGGASLYCGAQSSYASENYTGFRVAYMPDGWQPVPEPSSLLALIGGLGTLGGFVLRKKH